MVERLKTEYGVEVAWRAFLLRPDMPPEGMDLPPHLRAGYAETNERLRQMARAAGMEMVAPGRIPNSRRALEATEYAREQGQHEEFHRVVFRKFYGEGQDLSSWTVLRAAAVEVGLDPEAMQRETDSGKFRQAVEMQIAEAHILGITGVPAYIFNYKYAIIGAQPYEAFQRVMARLRTGTEDEPGAE